MSTTPNPLTVERITVGLTRKTQKALARAAESEGLTKTDIVNRALQLYDWMLDQQTRGYKIATLREDGDVERVTFLS